MIAALHKPVYRGCFTLIYAYGLRIAVGGTIDLGGPLPISNPYCTIAGQTAPGGGITLKNGSLIPQADHLIVRYIRCRLAEAGASKPQRDAVDHRLIQDVRAGKGKITRAVAEVGGWPKLSPGIEPTRGDAASAVTA